MIPILDYSRFTGSDSAGFVADFGRACRDTGFVVIANPPVSSTLRTRAFEMSRSFFASPLADKVEMSIARSPHNRGYSQVGEEFLDEKSGIRDSKEAFNIGLDLAEDDPRILAGEPFRGVNLWPDLPGFRDTMLAYFDAVHAFGVQLHRAIALDLGIEEDFFAGHLDQPLATLRLLRYPAATGAPGEIGAGEHTDYGTITLLTTDGVPGLQVRPRDGAWIDVPQVEDAYIINIADLLMRWSNDVYVSTPHRVLPPPAERYSLAFFLDPNPDSVITALPGTGAAKYPPVTGADYLASRLNATYEHKFGT
ncbi:isopenicillin N synthase family dioxygenase [Algicella marina]|uniref:2-oxoglutarate-dependent ethylene/succinate-forming enzyme n=1 Tax=Algicella marina TaxID=2683284 RepID=A0A6P1SWC3_9RHOB|nr:2-oxoglutarate and iron-dependent oxygenase domain-containing protein [Algicella marina]QHQ34067.1 isopenicillin N synthase family oxygenase [Algicella marina]